MRATTLAIMFTAVVALEPLMQSSSSARNNAYSRFLELASRASIRRSVNRDNLEKARALFQQLRGRMQPNEIKKWLRQEEVTTETLPEINLKDKQASLIEKELMNALSQKKSALLDRPYVQKEGRNDYLVMRPDAIDPFVTVIPNAIYYNIEKKCVNWLDDCSLKGIRAKLLQNMQSPYK